MAETYRAHILADAFKDQVAVYDCGIFKGHFPSFDSARQWVDAALAKHLPDGPGLTERLEN